MSGEFLVKRPSGCERVPDTAGARHIDRVPRGLVAILLVIGSESIARPCQVIDIPEADMVQILRRMVPITRATNGGEHGTRGTVLMSSTSSTRRVARQR